MRSQNQYQHRKKSQSSQGGCLGCFTGVLFSLLLCAGLLLFFGKAQIALDAVEAVYQIISTGQVGELLDGLDILPSDDEVAAAQQAQEDEAEPATTQELLAEVQASTSIFADGITRYAYTTLTDAEKISYILMAECVFSMQEEVELPVQAATETDTIETICLLLRADFPELFWIESSRIQTVTQGSNQQIYYIPTYSITMEERVVQQAQIEEMAQLYYQTISAEATDYEKVKAAYEFVVNHVTYCETEHDQTLYGALGQGQAVCSGYASALQYLLNNVGVTSGYVVGEATNESGTVTHAWNFVQIAGEYYYIDATWGESSWDNTVDYTYLCVTASDLATSHTASDAYTLPTVTGTAYNYHRVEGFYIEIYSGSAVQSALALQTGSSYYTLRFANAQEGQAAIAALIEQQGIYDIFRAIGVSASGISYTYNETLNVLVVSPSA